MAKKITKFSLLNIFLNLLTLKIINAIALYLLQFLTNFFAIATLGLRLSLHFEPFICHGILRTHRLDVFFCQTRRAGAFKESTAKQMPTTPP
jgi:hypothetical protein